MERDELKESLSTYSFYQTIDLGDGIKTPGRPTGPKQQLVLEHIRSLDLEGRRAVDLGCANGLFALEAEKQGASEVLAVDHTKKNIDSLEKIIIPHLESKVRPVHLNVLDFNATTYGQFDLVIFAGLLYHLRYPFSALKLIRDLLREDGTLILETGIIEDFNINSILHCPSSIDSPHKSRGGNACSFFNEKGLKDTLSFFGIRAESSTASISPVRRLMKKLTRKPNGSYWISNIILKCKRDSKLEKRALIDFYEGTTD